MNVVIKDGTGTGNEAEVDSRNRLRTLAVTRPGDKQEASMGKTWSYYFTTTPVGAGDFFFYLENTGEDVLTITDIRVMSAAAETINVQGVSGTPSYTASADVSPVNRHRGFSATIPSATAKKDTDITNLSDDGTLFFIRCDTANKMEHLQTTSNIFLSKGRAIALQAVTGTSLITCVVSVTNFE